jgi:hypothetical protein
MSSSQFDARYLVTEGELLRLVWKGVLSDRSQVLGARDAARTAETQARSRPVLPGAVPLTRPQVAELMHFARTTDTLDSMSARLDGVFNP